MFNNKAIKLKDIYNGHFKVKYRDIEMIKDPFDYLLYQMLVYEIKPDLIIEIGSNKRGSALYLSDLLDLIGNGEIHSIDLEDNIHPLVKSKTNIKNFFGGFENYDINITQNFEKIIIIDDGSHKYQDVLDALNKFSQIVSLGSYYIVEDGIITRLGLSKNFQGGPLKAIKDFLKNNDNFEIDRKYCDFFGNNTTFNVNGYLKRVK